MSHKIFNLLRRYFIAGVLVWIPVWVTLLVMGFIIDLLDSTLSLLPKPYQPDQLVGFHIPGLGIIAGFLFMLITGMLVTNFLGSRLVLLWDKIVDRIPLVRTVHTGVKQILHTVFFSRGEAFRKVLLVQYPRKGIWTIGFLTNKNFRGTENCVAPSEEVLAVFVPTTPNPTSGFLIIVPKKEVVEFNISVDEALKMVISLGTISPKALEEVLPKNENKNEVKH